MKPSHLHSVHADQPAAHGSVRSYTIGLLLSVALTMASFAAVMTGSLSTQAAIALVVGLCVAQLLVQLVYFLHLGTGPGQRGNTAIFACTGFLIVIVVAGSLWVMHNADINMMPTDMSIERARAKD
ncbi:Cytochrome bo(3) ubiquinol oxidase subunit 4 [compost metagenome]|uniref:Cytochrome bo(3) ubiquinol oxidase subunit 4 n=1 Tax=Cupriavidus necator (strain ATCC 17699 / DSM 428 / KCTC 22496 / NCIMB 10442 / H16 / Stanier 337) TaxID=381666 RepID=Q0KB49_CUPNH|nr:MULTISPECIES: cytochrome o ubiquinol oxidase subunit IV [Cupriavidus]EON19201.1 cytochrome o ubiquinol oxidase subunit IV [Cupriavidus sp. GA3-3]KUE88850.1 cytochrome o ubiquinol oxidase subunit IV [Cupriavidus necator]QCC00640.1 cytochrome o ubiquinol oxidase subunit IV [Cupriavidus necator H16]QQB76536.1 cytochrome o ubiquinol oxidase subunit IV [Cupriavidus necator]WKA42509.1 cytochrome o ubiquinol oxidase subunit IV [Cupriavidus necator]